MENTTFAKLQKMEAEKGSFVFNVEYLKGQRGKSSIYNKKLTEREADGTKFDQSDSQLTQTADALWMYWDLIPKDHGLGPEEERHKWLFGLANDNLIITAFDVDLDHGQHPIVVGAPETG